MSRGKASESSRNHTSRFGLALIVIVLLVVADVAAIGFALNGNRAPDIVTSPGAIPSYTPSASPFPPASPSVTPSATPRARDTSNSIALAPTRLIAARDATTAWRVLTGDCPTVPAAPQFTLDSGATWTTTDATAAARVTALQRIVVTGATSATLIGLSEADCSPQLVTATAGGRNLATHSEELVSAWYLNAANPETVHSPTGDHSAPCSAVIALAPRSAQSAAILCSDHSVSTTTDGGTNWTVPRAFAGAGNIAATAQGYLVSIVSNGGVPSSATGAVVVSVACTGVTLVPLSGDGQPSTPTRCLTLVTPLAVGSRAVALSVVSSTIWVWAGDVVMRSSDGGSTWR